MSIFEKVIFNNLIQHRSLILPNVGTLNVYRTSGSIDDYGNVISAPTNKIVFTEQCPVGTTIVDVVVELSGASAEEINKLYDIWAKDNCSITESGVKIGSVGYAQRQVDGGYVFVPSEELKAILNPVKEHSINVEKSVAEERPSVLPPAQPKNGSMKASSKQEKCSTKCNLVPVCIILSVALLLLVVWFVYDKLVCSNNSACGVETEQVAVEQVPEPVQQSSGADSVAKAAASQRVSNGKYMIIGGLFSVDANADKMIASLGADSIYAEKIKRPSGRILVSLRSFNTKAEAQSYMSGMENHVKNQYWIYERGSSIW